MAPLDTVNTMEKGITSSACVQASTRFSETGLLALIAACLGWFVLGKRTNKLIAYDVYNTVEKVLTEQFAVVGAYAETSPGLLQDSYSAYRVFASGRRFCRGCLVRIDLKKRQDLFSSLMADLRLVPHQDTLTIDIPMDDAVIVPFMAIIRSNADRKVRSELEDIDSFMAPCSIAALDDRFVSYSEHAELGGDLLDARIVEVLNNHADLVRVLYCSESSSVLPALGKRCLRLQVLIPAMEETPRIGELVALLCHLVDRIAAWSPRAASKKRMDKVRAGIQAEEERRVRAQREEQARKAREEKLREAEKNMTEEQKLKLDEKRKKRRMKKMQGGRRMIIS